MAHPVSNYYYFGFFFAKSDNIIKNSFGIRFREDKAWALTNKNKTLKIKDNISE